MNESVHFQSGKEEIMLVKNWMTTPVITVTEDESMQDAIYKLKDNNIKLLPVLKNDKLVGIVSDRDLKKASPSDATTLDVHELLYLISRIHVRDLMIKPVITVPDDYTVEEAAEIMMGNGISGTPVVNSKNDLVGIITKSDIFRVLMSITGIGKKGLQVCIRLKDMPGPIKEVRELIRKYGARTAGIFTSSENVDEGFLNVYFRIYDIDRQNVPSLLDELGQTGVLLYIVDHRENRRQLFPRD
jgi:acetoin utilization protein AcuB